jgi:uncharacterized membrane protein (DUF106 family)
MEEDKKETDKIEEKNMNILPSNKEGEAAIPLTAAATPSNKKAKEGSFMPILIIMVASFVIAGLWDKIPAIKNSIHYILDPTAGALLAWNLNFGMIIVVFVITLLTTLVQKYATDQKTLKEMKKEQKEIQKQMKEFKNHPEKLMELQKKQMAMLMPQMKLSMRAVAYTGIPFLLFFRWFTDYFAVLPEGTKFFLGMGWFLFYFIFAIIFGTIFRKYLDVV